MIAASVVALAGLGIFLGGRTTKAEQQLSDMQMANIEALTAGEINIDDCDNGCSTANTKQYCCTLLGFRLYRYK